MIFVFDTNTLISAILKPSSLSAKALTTAQQNGELIFSTETKEEFLSVVAREKFEKYVPFIKRWELAQSIISIGKILTAGANEKIECRDSKDVKFLDLALVGNADCLISGDVHLKELNPFRSIPILNPTDFIDWILSKKNPEILTKP